MSFWDSLIGGAGDLFSSVGDAVGNLGSDISGWFGGGGGGDLASATDTLSPVNVTPSVLSQGGFGSVDDFLNSGASGVGSLSGFGAGSNLTPMDTITNPSVVTGSFNPNSYDLSGFTPSPSGGLSVSGLLDPASSGLSKLLGSGGGGGGAATPQTSPTKTSTTPGGANTTTTPGGGTPSGGGILGGISGLLNNPAAIMGLISPVMTAINAKDQTDLGPDAAQLRTMAGNNQDQINALSAEAQGEKMGNLPGPAMAALSTSMANQKASLASRYAAMGMSGSSAEGADMAALNQQNESQRFQIGLNMANEGLSQVTGLQSQDVGIYQNLMDAQAQRDQEYMQAMSGVAEALGKAFSGSGNQTTGSTPSTATGINALTTLLNSSNGSGLLNSSTLNSLLAGTPTDNTNYDLTNSGSSTGGGSTINTTLSPSDLAALGLSA